MKSILGYQSQKILNFRPNHTSRNNGWIYGCFEPVFIEHEGNICFQEKPNYVLCNKYCSRSGCFVEYLNSKSKFLNALNLMASDLDVSSSVDQGQMKKLIHESKFIRY